MTFSNLEHNVHGTMYSRICRWRISRISVKIEVNFIINLRYGALFYFIFKKFLIAPYREIDVLIKLNSYHLSLTKNNKLPTNFNVVRRSISQAVSWLRFKVYFGVYILIWEFFGLYSCFYYIIFANINL